MKFRELTERDLVTRQDVPTAAPDTRADKYLSRAERERRAAAGGLPIVNVRFV